MVGYERVRVFECSCAYSILGHGFTGHHDDTLTAAQYIAHTIGRVVVALIVLSSHRRVLRSHIEIGVSRILVGTLLYVAFFWVGAETAGPPLDWYLGFTVLGAVPWIGVKPSTRRNVLLSIGAVLGFAVGILAVLPTAVLLIRLELLDPDASGTLWTHTEEWLFISSRSRSTSSVWARC